MVKHQTGAIATKIPDVPATIQVEVAKPVVPQRKLYFINEIVEFLLTRYLWSGGVDIELRDKIMSNAPELIRQIIRKQGLHTIYPGGDDSSFGDLINTAYMQIERTLYKYRAKAHCRHCFNPERPSDSVLYEPGDKEYGIKTLEEIVSIYKGHQCPHCCNLLKVEPLIMPKQGLYGGSESILYRGMSKVFNMWCVAPDTMLLTNNGIQTISNTINSDNATTYGLEGLQPIVASIRKPSQPTLKITTKLGYGIECTPEHKLYVLSQNGPEWKLADDLIPGDLLAIQFNQRCFGTNDEIVGFRPTKNGSWLPPKSFTSELAYIIGLFIAEGSYSYGKMVIYNVDDEVIKILENNNLGLNFIHEPKFQRISLCNVRFIEFLRWLGFPEHTTADTKEIPNRLWRCSQSIIQAMISGMFDGDGHSSLHSGTVGYTSTSDILIKQLRMLLLNFGMISKLSHDKRKSREFPAGYESKLHGSKQISLSTTDSAKFYSQIGFGITYKQAKHARLAKKNQILLYGIVERFRSLYKKYGCGLLGYNSIRRVLKSAWCTRDTAHKKLQSWSAWSNDQDFCFIRARLAEYDAEKDALYWVPIVNIKPSISEVCEISVGSNSHSYTADGLISHNSQVARTVILAYIKKEGRDRKNSPSYIGHLGNKKRPISGMLERFLSELRELWKFHDEHLKIINAIEWLFQHDDRPHDGVIGKIAEKTGLSRAAVTNFIQLTNLRSLELSDSNINRNVDEIKIDKRKGLADFEDESYD